MWMYQHGIWCETNTILCTELWSLYVCNGRIYVICVGNIIFCTPSWLIVQPNVFFHLFYLSSHCLLCNPPPCNSVTSHTHTHIPSLKPCSPVLSVFHLLLFHTVPHSPAVWQSSKCLPFLSHLAVALEPTLIHLLCPLIQFCFPFLDWILPFQSVSLSPIPAVMPSYSLSHQLHIAFFIFPHSTYFPLILPVFYLDLTVTLPLTYHPPAYPIHTICLTHLHLFCLSLFLYLLSFLILSFHVWSCNTIVLMTGYEAGWSGVWIPSEARV